MATKTDELKPPYPDAQLIHALEIKENEKIAEGLKDYWKNFSCGAEGIE